MKAQFSKSQDFLLVGGLLILTLIVLWLLWEEEPESIEFMQWGALGLAGIFIIAFHKRRLIWLTIALVPISLPIAFGRFESSASIPAEVFILFLAGYALIQLPRLEIRKSIMQHPITLLLMLDLAWLILASLFSSMPEVSAKRVFARLCFLIVFFFLISGEFASFRKIPKLYFVYAIGLIYPVYHTLSKHSSIGFLPQASFSMPKPYFADHTIYGAAIAFILPALALIFWKSKEFEIKRIGKWALGALLALLFIAEIFAFSRASWLSLFVSLGLYFAIRKGLRFRGFAAIVFGSMLIVGIFHQQIIDAASANKAVSNQGSAISHLKSVTNIQSDASNLERINRWICAFGMFGDRPLIGFGPGTYQFQYGAYQTTSQLTHISTRHGDRGNAHSEYLTYLSETGLPGFLIFLSLVLLVFKTSFRLIENTKGPKHYTVIGILLGLTTWFFHGVFNSFIDQDKIAVLVFASYAALVAIDISNKNEGFTKEAPTADR